MEIRSEGSSFCLITNKLNYGSTADIFERSTKTLSDGLCGNIGACRHDSGFDSWSVQDTSLDRVTLFDSVSFIRGTGSVPLTKTCSHTNTNQSVGY